MRNELSPQQPNAVQQFTEQDARILIEDMLLTYGKKFTDQWAGLKKSQIISKFTEKLTGLTYEQFQRGLKRLDTATWPPSINEFKAWCKDEYEYQTSDDAWLQALNYEKHNRSHSINNFAKQAFDEVVSAYGHFGTGDTFYKVFSSVYKRLISEAKERNEADYLLTAVAQISTSTHDSNHAPISNDLAQQQLANLKAKMNVRNRHVPKPQKLEANKARAVIHNEWPDPFENPSEYQSMMANGFNRVLGGGV